MSKKQEMMEYLDHLISIGVDDDEKLSYDQGIKFCGLLLEYAREINCHTKEEEAIVEEIYHRMNKMFEDYCYE